MPLIWKLIGVFAIAGGHKGVRAQAAAGRGKAARRVGHHASRREHREVEEVPAVQRQVLHRSIVDDLADGDSLRFNLLNRTLHLHRLSGGGDGEMHVHRNRPVDIQRDFGHGVGAESGGGGLDFVVAGLQRRHNIKAGRVGVHNAIGAGRQAMHGHFRIRDHRAARIGNSSRKAGSRLRSTLAKAHSCKQDRHENIKQSLNFILSS